MKIFVESFLVNMQIIQFIPAEIYFKQNVLCIVNILLQVFASENICGIFTLHLDLLTCRLRESEIAGRRNTDLLIHGDFATVRQSTNWYQKQHLLLAAASCVTFTGRRKIAPSVRMQIGSNAEIWKKYCSRFRSKCLGTETGTLLRALLFKVAWTPESRFEPLLHFN